MKKYVKIIIIILVVLAILLILNTIRNVSIINKLRNNANEYCSDMTSYKITIVYDDYAKVISNSNETVEGTYTETVYYKNNKFIKKTLFQCEGLEDEENTEELEESTYLDYMKIDFFLNEYSKLSNKIGLYCLNFIKTNDDCYIINFDNIAFYFNKETGLLKEYPISTYSIEKNTVTDEEFENL